MTDLLDVARGDVARADDQLRRAVHAQRPALVGQAYARRRRAWLQVARWTNDPLLRQASQLAAAHDQVRGQLAAQR
jgi:hypothetical protein